MNLPKQVPGMSRMLTIGLPTAVVGLGVMASRTRSYGIALSPEEEHFIRNLKPGQVAEKTITFTADLDTAARLGNCCPFGKCCCDWDCTPPPCVGTCTAQIVVK